MCKHSGFRPAPRDWSSLPPAFALIVLCSTPASAQVAGTISGYVHDQAGGVMPGVTVTAESAGQQRIRSTESNATGFFDLQALPRGIYAVKVEIAGFETQVRKDVEVTAGANVRLDFSLRVGGLAENVIVSGRATMVETRNATQSNLIDDQRVQDLPMNGRNVVALAGTYAGVTAIRASQDTSDGRQGPIMSVNGGNQNHNLFTLNGSVFTHFNQTTGFNPPPPDAVQEIRIQTHNFSAEYGHTAGSQASIVSKAGTNDFHGTAWEFHRNSALNARSFFQTRKPQQRQNQTGASAGGPLIRNRLFWFGAYQRLWDRSEAGSSQTIVPTDAQRIGNFSALGTQLRNPVNPITGAPFTDSAGAPCIAANVISASCISPVARGLLDRYVPSSASGIVVTLSPAPRNNAVYLARGDYHVSDRNQLSAHFFADRSDSSTWPGNVNYVQQGVFSDVNQFGVSDTHIVGPRLVNEATVSYLTSRSGGSFPPTPWPIGRCGSVDCWNTPMPSRRAMPRKASDRSQSPNGESRRTARIGYSGRSSATSSPGLWDSCASPGRRTGTRRPSSACMSHPNTAGAASGRVSCGTRSMRRARNPASSNSC